MTILKTIASVFLIFLFSANIFADGSTDTLKKFLKALEMYKDNATSPNQVKLNTQIKKYCNFVLNTDYMGRQAMRDNWNNLTPAQRSEYMSLLKQIIEKIVYRDASNQLRDMRITYRGATQVSAVRWKVFADVLIISERIDMKAVYVLEKTGNFFRVIDAFFDDESIIEDYRSEFNRIIKTHGFSGSRESLINRMQRTLRQNIIDDARTKKRAQKRAQRRQH